MKLTLATPLGCLLYTSIRFVPKDDEARESEAERPLPRIAVTPDKVRVLLTERCV